ncbi:MAG: hypothetical protein ACFFE2_02870 [Candidatus Thorarchaeota archaeon]
MAKKAVDSTLRKILNYTAEIILSIILLVIICIPLAFTIPQWFQTIALGIRRDRLALDPVHWFGLDGAVWLTLLLGAVSFLLGYVFILRLKPGSVVEEEFEEDEVDEEGEEAEEEIEEVEVEDEELDEEEREEELLEEVEAVTEDVTEEEMPEEDDDVMEED